MAKSMPAYHDDSDEAYPVRVIKIVPSVPAVQSERTQLRPVMPMPVGE